MVWMPAHTGTFLDSIDGERLFALFCLVCHCGLRRDEVVGLAWATALLGHSRTSFTDDVYVTVFPEVAKAAAEAAAAVVPRTHRRSQ